MTSTSSYHCIYVYPTSLFRSYQSKCITYLGHNMTYKNIKPQKFKF